MKATTKQIGDYGESIAEKYLKKRFWRIVSRNFRARGGEIDIIAYRFGILAFIEVKTRSNDLYGRPSDAVDYEKLKRIRNSARQFCEMYHVGRSVPLTTITGNDKRRNIIKKRIDVIEVYLSRDGLTEKINHIKDWEKQL